MIQVISDFHRYVTITTWVAITLALPGTVLLLRMLAKRLTKTK